MLETLSAEGTEQIQTIEKSVSTILAGAEMLHATGLDTSDSAVAYVREMQRAAATLARAISLAQEGGFDAEAIRLRKQQSGIDASIARHLTAIAKNIPKERYKTITTLNAVFKLGHAPDTIPDGVFRGQLLCTSLFGPLDAFGRFVARFYMPWKGKRFDAETATGRNIFKRSAVIVGRLLWPLYGDWRRYKPGYRTGFKFDTYIGQGAEDPEVSTFKLDYDNPTNPGLLVRDVLDELVQITDNYYLGKAMLMRPGGHLKLAAFFVLRKQR